TLRKICLPWSHATLNSVENKRNLPRARQTFTEVEFPCATGAAFVMLGTQVRPFQNDHGPAGSLIGKRATYTSLAMPCPFSPNACTQPRASSGTKPFANEMPLNDGSLV